MGGLKSNNITGQKIFKQKFRDIEHNEQTKSRLLNLSSRAESNTQTPDQKNWNDLQANPLNHTTTCRLILLKYT
jgi:hypothetical protein